DTKRGCWPTLSTRWAKRSACAASGAEHRSSTARGDAADVERRSPATRGRTDSPPSSTGSGQAHQRRRGFYRDGARPGQGSAWAGPAGGGGIQAGGGGGGSGLVLDGHRIRGVVDRPQREEGEAQPDPRQ